MKITNQDIIDTIAEIDAEWGDIHEVDAKYVAETVCALLDLNYTRKEFNALTDRIKPILSQYVEGQ